MGAEVVVINEKTLLKPCQEANANREQRQDRALLETYIILVKIYGLT